MTVVARFHAGKLVGYGALAFVLLVVGGWMLATGDRGSARIMAAGAMGVFAGLVAIITAIRIAMWRGPAIRVQDNALHAFGQSRPIPISTIGDVQVSASDTDSQNWMGVLLYHDGRLTTRLHSWLLAGDRRRIALRLRSALGLPVEGLRR
jgi:hypothetical protein